MYTTGTQPSNEVLTINFVNGRQMVDSFYVLPGVTAFLFDFSSSTFYIKSTDIRGISQPIRIFSFDEISTASAKADDSDKLQQQIDELRKLVEGCLNKKNIGTHSRYKTKKNGVVKNEHNT